MLLAMVTCTLLVINHDATDWFKYVSELVIHHDTAGRGVITCPKLVIHHDGTGWCNYAYNTCNSS